MGIAVNKNYVLEENKLRTEVIGFCFFLLINAYSPTIGPNDRTM
jgi:hypothetical protein